MCSVSRSKATTTKERRKNRRKSAKVFHPPFKFKCYFWTHSIEHSTRIRTVESKGKKNKYNENQMKCRESKENSLLHAHSSIICVQI